MGGCDPEDFAGALGRLSSLEEPRAAIVCHGRGIELFQGFRAHPRVVEAMVAGMHTRSSHQGGVLRQAVIFFCSNDAVGATFSSRVGPLHTSSCSRGSIHVAVQPAEISGSGAHLCTRTLAV